MTGISIKSSPLHISMHARLRASTRPLHERAESAVDLAFYLSSMPNYCRLLQTLWRLHAGYDAYFESLYKSDCGIDFRFRRRAGSLLNDLAQLGSGPFGIPIEPPLSGHHELVGGLYVLEGSTLGGRILLKHAHSRLGVTAAFGASFFHGYGEGTTFAWKTLLAAINETPAVGEDADAMERGAKTTFETFIAAFAANMCADEQHLAHAR